MTQDPRPQSQYASLPEDSAERIFTEKELSRFSTFSLLKLARLKGAKGLKISDTRPMLTRSVLTAQIPKPVGRPRNVRQSSMRQGNVHQGSSNATKDQEVKTQEIDSDTKQSLLSRLSTTERPTSHKHTCPTCGGRGFVLAEDVTPATNSNTSTNTSSSVNSSNSSGNSNGNNASNGHVEHRQLYRSTNGVPIHNSSTPPIVRRRGRKPNRRGPSLPQIRVICVLAKAEGPLTKAKISALIGNKTNVLAARAIGYSNPVKRAAFENSRDGGFRPSLLTLGYVAEICLDIDGVEETAYELTDSGKVIYKRLQDEGKTNDLPALRDYTV